MGIEVKESSKNPKRTPLEFLREIETNYPVETVTARNIQVWPYLRIYLFSAGDAFSHAGSGKSSIFRTFLSGIFYGFPCLFKKYDHIFFSDTMERRKIGTLYYDKSIDYISEILPRSLDIEIPLPAHYRRKDVPTTNIVSKVPFYFIEAIYAKLFLFNLKLKNKQVLDEIFSKYNIDISYMSLVRRFISQYVMTKKLVRRFKPRTSFIGCYYTNTGRIVAFREKGVRVVEIQHGVISNEHIAYNLFKRFDEKCFPEYLLTFGESEVEVSKSKDFYIRPENVFPVGSFYIDHLNSNPAKNSLIDDFRSKYKFIVCVSGQNHYTEPLLIDFLNKVANLSSEILFIFVPRDNRFDENKYNLNKNIYVSSGLNCYEMISLCDFHSTVFSTCALEAPSLGIPNNLINIKGLSKLHYENVLNNKTTTMYADSPEEYVQLINSYTFAGKNTIRDLNKHIIKPGYKENIQKVLKEMSLL